MKAVEQTDEAAARLLRDYQAQGCIAVTVRALPNGTVSAIFPRIDPKLITTILRTAADNIAAPPEASIH